MKNRFISKNKNGFTLIELLLTLALLSIIIAVAVNFLLFNNKVYNKSENLSQVQFDVRMASDYIALNVRNSDTISTTDNGSFSSSLDIDGLQKKYSFVKSIDFEIRKEEQKYLLSYEIQGSDSKGENEYALVSEVLLNNITSTTTSNGSAIYFKK